MIWKSLLITLAFLAAGSPWTKDVDKSYITEAEPPQEIIETIAPAPSNAAAPVETRLPVVEWSEQVVEWVDDVVSGGATEEPAEEAQEPIAEEEVDIGDGWSDPISCTITHFCNCAVCCGKWAGSPTASGAWPVAGRTVAVDKSVIPLGSEVLINGHIYIAEDTGVKGNWIDIFCNSHQEALNRGMYTTTVQWR